MKGAEKVFLRTLQDIETRIPSNDFYEVLGIAALLRKLLLDKTPLVNRVNRSYGLKIKFRVSIVPPRPDVPGIPPPVFFFAATGIDPDVRPGAVQLVSKDEFLKVVVIKHHEYEYTVRDVIKFEANIAGAVHFGDSKDLSEEMLVKTTGLEDGNEGRGTLFQLKPIAKIVLEALQPLKDEVIKQNRK